MAYLNTDQLWEWEERSNIAEVVGSSALQTPVELLEVTVSADKRSSLSKAVLKPDQLRVWLNQQAELGFISTQSAASARHCLKLIVAGCDRIRPAGDFSTQNTTMDDFPLPQIIRPSRCPFSLDLFELLRSKFCLPRETYIILPDYSIFYSTSGFHVFTLDTPDVPENEDKNSFSFILKFPGSDLVRTDTSLAVSYSPRSRESRALLLCRCWEQASYMSETVLRLAEMCTHPMSLPAILNSLYQLSLTRNINTTWEDVFQVELSSGQSGITILQDGMEVLSPAGNGDDPDLSRKAIRALQLATAWVSYVNRSRALVADTSGFLADMAVNECEDLVIKQGRMLEKYLELAAKRGESMEHRAQHLVERARIQVEAINNHLAHTNNRINLELARASQQIAWEAQRDSSSMKAIAVLTMTFLPATYIASLFATPGVSSKTPSQGLYWAVSLPITAVVLGIWALWVYGYRRDSPTHRAPRNGAAQKHAPPDSEATRRYPVVPGEVSRNPELRQLRRRWPHDNPQQPQFDMYPETCSN